VPLGQRTFHCSRCGFEADRDTNAAINLGQYPRLTLPTSEKALGVVKHACGRATLWLVTATATTS